MSRAKRDLKLSDVLMFSPFAALVPVGAALVHFLTHRSAWSRPARWALAGSAAAVGVGLARWQLNRLAQPAPQFTLVERQGDLEIRTYPACVVLSTDLTENFDTALDDGFERLVKYLNGENATGEKMEMTSPVTSQRNANHYTVSFFMPPHRPLRSLPRPLDTNLRLVRLPERTVAVLPFHGRYDAEHVKSAMEHFKALTDKQQLKVHGRPVFAAFDAPSTLPMLRHNEVWCELTDAASLRMPLPHPSARRPSSSVS
ncbi:MAG: heme-binding protein [Archangiaceae bacterium]|nr:heme-binding protein [Archangiaceae bacterium]